MTTLHIDFETRSKVDLPATGVYVYAADLSTDVWCAAYAVDDGPVELWVPHYRPYHDGNISIGKDSVVTTLDCADVIRKAIEDNWTIVAHNANFERAMWAGVLTPRYGWPLPKLEQWRCTMAAALSMSLPASLNNAAAAVGLDQGKDMGGRDLMLRMSHPRKARKGENPDGVYWFEDDERKQRLYEYCRQDVSVERELDKRLLKLRPSEQVLWQLDQIINDRGVYVDAELCRAATKIVETAAGWLNDEIYELTGTVVSRTTNVADLRRWLKYEGIETDSLDKEAISNLLIRTDLSAPVRRVLQIRQEAAKASVAKIETLMEGRNADGRVRGLLQFHAAGTGRWAGRRFQPQNIKRPELEDVDGAIAAVATGSADYVKLLYGPPLAVVGDTLRGMLVAAPGKKLLAADFSNIEGRLIAWIAGEEWKLQAFRDFDAGIGHDIYILTAAKLLGKDPGPISNPTITKAERQGSGKVPELALGFQGGVGAFQKMAVIYGVSYTDERAEEIKVAWRAEHPAVVQCWYDLENAAVSAIENRGQVFDVGPISFRVAGSFLFMRLPSGRAICYPYPCIKPKLMPWTRNEEIVSLDGMGNRVVIVIKHAVWKDSVCYKGVDTFTRKWTDCFAHGGLLFNNAVQGTARDIEAEAMTRLAAAGYETGDPKGDGIVLTVHDEIVCEVAQDFGGVEEFERIMVTLPTWAEGLPIAAGAWEGQRYKK